MNMRYREIGNSGIQASIIGLGTWAVGGGSWWGETDDAESVRTIHTAIDTGITLIDTAPAYGWGRSEEVVGRAIKDRRDKVVLSTKCGLWWHDSQGSLFFEMEGRKVNRSLRPATIRQEIEMSLKRLGTDYIDIYHTHWQAVEPDKTPIAETMDCLLELKKEGKIRSIAVSNVTVEQLDEYTKAGDICANQAKYSMLDRELEKEGLTFCRQNNIGVLAYSPLEQGLLTGKIGMDRQFDEKEYRNQIPWFKPQNRKKVLDMLEGWKDITMKYGCTISQLVVAWTASQEGIASVLCGARHPEQIVETAVGGSLILQEQDVFRMRLEGEALGEPV
jgi:methylglyoxal reductase